MRSFSRTLLWFIWAFLTVHDFCLTVLLSIRKGIYTPSSVIWYRIADQDWHFPVYAILHVSSPHFNVISTTLTIWRDTSPSKCKLFLEFSRFFLLITGFIGLVFRFRLAFFSCLCRYRSIDSFGINISNDFLLVTYRLLRNLYIGSASY